MKLKQQEGNSPIIVNNPNDPRLKAYNDSLNIYNFYKSDDKFWTENAILKRTNMQGRYPENSLPNPAAELSETKIKPTGYNNYNYPKRKYTADRISIPVYKQPVQPIIYQEASNKVVQPLIFKKQQVNPIKKPTQPIVYQKDNPKPEIVIPKNTRPLPKDLVKYPTQGLGSQTVPARQFIDLHKTDFNNELMKSNNDSTTAFNSLVNNLQTPRKVGSYNDFNKAKNPLLTDSTKQSFLIKRQKGGEVIKNYVEPFHNSPYNFLNKPIMKDLNYESAIPFIVEHEGKKLDDKGNHVVYKDGKGIDTIGYGLTSKQFISKGKISEEEARQGMRMHIDKEILPHLKNKPYWNNLSENQKTALTSYVYNIGSGAFNAKSPSLQKALSESNWNEAAKQMDFGYNDIKNPGLKTRRDKEQRLFLQDYDKVMLNQLPTFRGYLK